MSAPASLQPERFPPPPRGRDGWPWLPRPDVAPTPADDLPRISVVTPSYNQGAFLEETIRSVLVQGYPELEYIIIDGGSTDGSVDVIRKYEPHLAFWTSERDEGAADALAKGFARTTGEILAWLNTDDVYQPGVLARVASYFREKPECDVLFGDTYWVDPEGRVLAERRQTPFLPEGYLYGGADLQQPSTFWTRAAYEQAGGIDRSYRFAFDTDLFFRFVVNGADFRHLKRFFASFRLHPAAKSSNEIDVCKEELQRIRETYLKHGYRSAYGRYSRNLSRLRRLFMYMRQGDLGWLVGRVPDRMRAGGSGLAAGPRSEWM